MYIPNTPLPSFSLLNSIQGSFYKELKNIVCKDEIEYFSRGAQALAAIGRSLNKTKPVFLFPSYYCNSSLIPLRISGAELLFYKVCPDLSPDWKHVKELSVKFKPDFFVLVHYFGMANDTLRAELLSEQLGFYIIQDCAHVLFFNDKIRYTNDYFMFSFHKNLPLPPIAAVVSKKLLINRMAKPKHTVIKSIDMVWCFKRLIQKYILQHKRRLDIEIPSEDEYVATKSGRTMKNQKVSDFVLFLLKSLSENMSQISKKRIKNYNFLKTIFSEHNGFQLFSYDWVSGEVPYSLPVNILYGHQSEIYKSIRTQGIPVETWPDLPPEVILNKEIYLDTINLKNRILFFPVHQSLRDEHLMYMETQIRRAIHAN